MPDENGNVKPIIEVSYEIDAEKIKKSKLSITNQKTLNKAYDDKINEGKSIDTSKDINVIFNEILEKTTENKNPT